MLPNQQQASLPQQAAFSGWRQISPLPPSGSKLSSTLYGVWWTVYSAQCTVYRVQCTLYSVYCTLHRLESRRPRYLNNSAIVSQVHSRHTLRPHTVHRTVHCTVHCTVHRALYSAPCTVQCTVHCTVHSALHCAL